MWSCHVEDVLGLLDGSLGRNPGHGLLHGYRAWPHCGWALVTLLSVLLVQSTRSHESSGHKQSTVETKHVFYQSVGTKRTPDVTFALHEHETFTALTKFESGREGNTNPGGYTRWERHRIFIRLHENHFE
jgi:hypothetical protein